MESTQAIKKNVTKSAVSAEKVYVSQFQKEGTETAQLRQIVESESEYPSARISNERQDNLFSVEDFGFTAQKFTNIENRVGFINVPVGTTVEKVAELLLANPDACLYRVMDNRPIITKDQEYAIAQGQRTYDDFANSQVVRFPEADSNGVAHPRAGQIVLDRNNKPQYRQVFFSKAAMADEDNRKADTAYGYVSPEIEAELVGAAPTNATVVKEQGL